MFLLEENVPRSLAALYDSETGEGWTHGRLREEVSGLAAQLRSDTKSLVFCFCRNDAASVAWYLAAVEAGQAVALLDANLDGELKRRLIRLYRPEIILASREGLDLGGVDPAYRMADSHGRMGACWRRSADAPEPPVHPDLALLLSTSGSTGSPKFVRLTKGNVLGNAQAIIAALAIASDDVAISSLPLHYSYGLSVLNTHLSAGARIVLTNEGLFAPGFWEVFRKFRCTSFAGVPYSYQILRRLGLDRLDVPTLHTATQAGGKLADDLVAEFHQAMNRRKGRFFVMYGQTEATARIATLPPTSLPEKLGSVGLPLPGGSFAIEVDGHPTTAAGQKGELVYSGPNVMMGYATDRADLSLGDVLGGRLHTGDAAHLDADGFLYVAGRMKRDAKLFGLRVNLDELEGLLRQHGPTAAVAVGDKVRLYCEYGDDDAFARHRRELADLLKIHHQAFEFVRIERLPRNSSGKVDYQALAELP